MLKELDHVIVTVHGTPVPKGRARARIAKGRNGKQFISHYTPKKTAEWENRAKMVAKLEMGPRKPITRPVALHLSVYIAPPGGWPEWKKEAAIAGDIRPTSKPDLDNVEKAVKDALNGIVYVDDSQVVQTTQAKHYALAPGIAVKIVPLPEAPAQVANRREFENAMAKS